MAKCSAKIGLVSDPTENSVLYEHHFLPQDFKEERSDKNYSRMKGKDVNLKRKELKPNGVHSQWPECPKLLSKTPQNCPTCSSTSTACYQLRLEEDKKNDTYISLDNLEIKLDMSSLPNNIIKSRSASNMFFSVSYEGKPVNYCLKLNNDLQFELWCRGQMITVKYHPDQEISSCPYIKSCNLLLKMLEYLEDEFNKDSMVRTDKDKISNIVEVIKVEHLDDNNKIAFLAKQLSLVYSSPHGRRYSPSLIAMAYMWQSVSPALYKQVQLVVRTLSSSIGDDLELTQPAKRYMSARFKKLKETDHEVSLIMDKVYCQKKSNIQMACFMEWKVTKSPRLTYV